MTKRQQPDAHDLYQRLVRSIASGQPGSRITSAMEQRLKASVRRFFNRTAIRRKPASIEEVISRWVERENARG